MRARNALIVALAAAATLTGCARESFAPSEDDHDPSRRISGVQIFEEKDIRHVLAPERVEYPREPPTGGAHDLVWADCMGTVYDVPVRNENMVHAIEHGAVWIAYHPDQITGPALESLKQRVVGKPYTMLSPYPDLAAPISLQAWGHQLRVSSADDERIDQFIEALRSNPYVVPEVNSPCQAYPGSFDPANPPPFGS